MFRNSKQRVDSRLLPPPPPPCTSNNSTLLHTNPSEDSQAWKKYSYLDEGSARGIVWHNRRRIQCTVACIESDSNTAPFTEGNQIWQSCVKILICLERISTPYFWEKWKSMLTAACQCYIFRTSDLNRGTELPLKKGIMKRYFIAKGQSYIVNKVKTQRFSHAVSIQYPDEDRYFKKTP